MYRLTIVTPEKPFYDGDVDSLVAPGSDGYFGVLTGHAPFLTALAPGELKVKEHGGLERHFAVSGGFFEVSHNHATLLADAIEEPGVIDLARAEEAVKRARARLSEHLEGTDLIRAERALLRARNRLEMCRRHGA